LEDNYLLKGNEQMSIYNDKERNFVVTPNI